MKAMKTNVHNSLKDLVGASGFEPEASCAQGRRATRLRYAPTVIASLILKHFPTLLLLRSLVLYRLYQNCTKYFHWTSAVLKPSISLARWFIVSKSSRFICNFI
jgi:hypothetical protein